MSEKQLLQFVVGGGLDGGCTLSPAALQRSKERVKHLLLVSGSAWWDYDFVVSAVDGWLADWLTPPPRPPPLTKPAAHRYCN